MAWEHFIWFATSASALWTAGAVIAAFKNRRRLSAAVSLCGSLVFLAFIIWLGISLGRPPLRTSGETRLWYSFFLSVTGLGIYLRWGYRWIPAFSSLMAIMFACINLFKPEIHTEALPAALQSPWFVPHVIVYMFAYALMGAATIFGAYLWWKDSRKEICEDEMASCDKLVRLGWAFLTMGMVMGALWAKQAWGDFWSWDPKETWAAATWLSYLLYLHARPRLNDKNIAFGILMVSFLLLQMCWWGVNYLPGAQGMSIHSY